MAQIKQKALMRKKAKISSPNSFKCEPIDAEPSNQTQTKTGAKPKMKKKSVEAKKEISTTSTEPATTNENVVTESAPTNEPKSRKRKRGKKDNRFYSKVAKSRKEKGMILLPQKIETKIYKLKKALKKKGMDDAEIREIIRRKRREEELKVRKDMKHACFKCRQTGHSLANCPQADQDESSGDICYFCGSSEHRLSECAKHKSSNKKGGQQNLPYARCFICKQTGHLTRTCKQNENGVFPKGGKCRICGSVNHLVKDCARNTDKSKEEKEIILKTYGDVTQGVDVDDFEIVDPNRKAKSNVPRVVKF